MKANEDTLVIEGNRKIMEVREFPSNLKILSLETVVEAKRVDM